MLNIHAYKHISDQNILVFPSFRFFWFNEQIGFVVCAQWGLKIWILLLCSEENERWCLKLINVCFQTAICVQSSISIDHIISPSSNLHLIILKIIPSASVLVVLEKVFLQSHPHHTATYNLWLWFADGASRRSYIRRLWNWSRIRFICSRFDHCLES